MAHNIELLETMRVLTDLDRNAKKTPECKALVSKKLIKYLDLL